MELADGIDIAAYSIAHSEVQMMQGVSTAILAKTLDMAEIQGAELTRLMELSVNPDLGSNIDILL